MAKHIMQTYSGGPFNLLEPQADDIRLLDIAEALSKINRFNGHTTCLYSVAQHSVIVSMLLAETDYAMDGLMHDAHEAYIGDFTSPVKAALKEINGGVLDMIALLEEPIRLALAAQFSLRHPIPDAVHQADLRALQIERSYFLHPSTAGVPWTGGVHESDKQWSLQQLTPAEARDAFVHRFKMLEKRPKAANLTVVQ